MTVTEEVKALLEADTALMNLLTGGIHIYEALRGGGITRGTVPGAYAGGKMLPHLIIRERGQIPMGLRDEGSNMVTVESTVELHLYNAATATYATLNSAEQRIFELLNFGKVGYQARMQNKVSIYDPTRENANHLYLTYQINHRREQS